MKIGLVVAYALPVGVVDDSISSLFREAELSSNSELWRRLSPFMSTILGNLLSCSKGRRPFDANVFLRRRMDLQMVLSVTKPG